MGTALGGDIKRILDNHYCSLTKSLAAIREAGLSAQVLPLLGVSVSREDGSKPVLSGICGKLNLR